MEAGDMDIDMDIDLGPIDAVEVNQPLIDVPQIIKPAEGTTAVSETSNADSEKTTPHKIHIRGVDDMTTQDIKDFSLEHFTKSPSRIEWIDDTSANIVYDTPGTGFAALDQLSLTVSTELPLSHLRAAKPSTTRPGSTLQIRIALATDQKKPRAYESSRFYLTHPEHDPREQRRRNRNQSSNGDYSRRRYGADEGRRRRKRDKEEGFDASMYDDDDKGSSSRRESIASSSDSRSRQQGDFYRPLRRDSRDRSASPGSINGHTRRRYRTPPPKYRRHDPNPVPAENTGKELFPSKAGQNGAKIGKDLFSNKMMAKDMKKELFPQKASAINHRRSDAFDAADETADLFARRMSVPFANDSKRPSQKSLADRITAPGESSYGRLNGSDPDPPIDADYMNSSDVHDHTNNGITIRGSSSRREINVRGASTEINIRGASQDQGFSIRGGSRTDAKIKELFPEKATGNAGKELLAGRLDGRGAKQTRARAEDMFY